MSTATPSAQRRFAGTTRELIAAMMKDARGKFREEMKDPAFREAWMRRCGYRKNRKGEAYVVPV